MKTNTEFQIDADLTAALTDEGYLLTIRSEELDDYDTYKLEDGEWVLSYDSLSNGSDKLDWLWEDKPEFKAWTEEMKAHAKSA